MSSTAAKSPGVYVADCELGRGLFAARDFAAGEKILLLNGRTISFTESVAMCEKQSNPVQIAAADYVDIEPPGVFTNHSCEPNAGIANSLELVALRQIKAGDEIRFDYSTTMDEDHWTMACMCKAKNCRGVVRDFRLLPAETQQRYLQLGVVQEFIVRKMNHTPLCRQAR